MKFVERRPFANPDAAARKLVEIANGVEPVQDGRIYIERVNAPFLAAGGTGDDFRAGSWKLSPDLASTPAVTENSAACCDLILASC